jgi:ABC-type glycerol-3-phosphate transport system permease component
MGSPTLAASGLRAGRLASKVLLYALISLFGLLMVMPFYWMISTSFQAPENVISFPPKWWPQPPVLDHYRDALAQAPFFLYYRNSTIVAVIQVICCLVIGLFAGYAFAVYRFPLRGFFFILTLATLMVPIQVTSVSLYILMARLRWIDSYLGILAPNLASAFAVFLIRQSIMSVPFDLIDAARIDGSGEVRIVVTIIAPLVKSTLATIALILFIDSWNDFLWPVIIINSQWLRTIPVGIAFFKDPYHISFGPLMAATSITTMPMIFIYVFIQKFIIKGIATSGIKL